jgi:hypothetical protein
MFRIVWRRKYPFIFDTQRHLLPGDVIFVDQVTSEQAARIRWLWLMEGCSLKNAINEVIGVAADAGGI